MCGVVPVCVCAQAAGKNKVENAYFQLPTEVAPVLSQGLARDWMDCLGDPEMNEINWETLLNCGLQIEGIS